MEMPTIKFRRRLMLGRRLAGLAAIVSEMDAAVLQELSGQRIPVVFYDVGTPSLNITKDEDRAAFIDAYRCDWLRPVLQGAPETGFAALMAGLEEVAVDALPSALRQAKRRAALPGVFA